MLMIGFRVKVTLFRKGSNMRTILYLDFGISSTEEQELGFVSSPKETQAIGDTGIKHYGSFHAVRNGVDMWLPVTSDNIKFIKNILQVII